jgi:hypothetical protein
MFEREIAILSKDVNDITKEDVELIKQSLNPALFLEQGNLITKTFVDYGKSLTDLIKKVIERLYQAETLDRTPEQIKDLVRELNSLPPPGRLALDDVERVNDDVYRVYRQFYLVVHQLLCDIEREDTKVSEMGR